MPVITKHRKSSQIPLTFREQDHTWWNRSADIPLHIISALLPPLPLPSSQGYGRPPDPSPSFPNELHVPPSILHFLAQEFYPPWPLLPKPSYHTIPTHCTCSYQYAEVRFSEAQRPSHSCFLPLPISSNAYRPDNAPLCQSGPHFQSTWLGPSFLFSFQPPPDPSLPYPCLLTPDNEAAKLPYACPMPRVTLPSLQLSKCIAR